MSRVLTLVKKIKSTDVFNRAPMLFSSKRTILDSPEDPYCKDLSLGWNSGGVGCPHPNEWIPQQRGSFEREFKFVEQLNGVLRPYVTIPLVFEKDQSVEYPVTFFADSGSPSFFLSHLLFETYRASISAKHDTNTIIGRVTSVNGNGHIRLIDPGPKSNVWNVNVLSYDWMRKEAIMTIFDNEYKGICNITREYGIFDENDPKLLEAQEAFKIAIKKAFK